MMSGRTQKFKYGHFRTCVEACSGSKERLRDEVIPSFAAWLLLMGTRQQKVIKALEGRVNKGAFPGLNASLAFARQYVQTVEHLIHNLIQMVPRDEWDRAVEVVADAFEIEAESPPIHNPPVADLKLKTHAG